MFKKLPLNFFDKQAMHFKIKERMYSTVNCGLRTADCGLQTAVAEVVEDYFSGRVF